ncbi:hypothetical protein QYF61_010702 [Mycteria americana]|uniref:Uncharacterized protein n=1 Tax=Mycteria americana TaxID=33587 RepID=A0AAN7NFG4_MYCAM|nr:hypothetical protein QYF61_010702 [Mycteria americana]
MLGKNSVVIPKRHNVSHCAGPWLVSTKQCSVLCSILNEKRGKTRMTGTEVAPATVTDTAATLTPATGTAAKPGNQPVPISVAPIHKKKSWKQKSTHLERDEEAPPKREQEEEAYSRRQTTLKQGHHENRRRKRKNSPLAPEEELGRRGEKELINKAVTIRSLSLSELQDMEGGIDKAIGKGAQTLNLRRRILSAMKERYPFREDVICHPGKWTTMERGIQYLRELAMLEVIYGDLDNEQLSKDPDEVSCTRPMWRKLVRSAPVSCANSSE